jgi:hypothetical protein
MKSPVISRNCVEYCTVRVVGPILGKGGLRLLQCVHLSGSPPYAGPRKKLAVFQNSPEIFFVCKFSLCLSDL